MTEPVLSVPPTGNLLTWAGHMCAVHMYTVDCTVTWAVNMCAVQMYTVHCTVNWAVQMCAVHMYIVHCTYTDMDWPHVRCTDVH